MKNLVLAVAGVLTLASGAWAEKVEPKALWYNGLSGLSGKFVFVQPASPGGLYQKDRRKSDLKLEVKQLTVDELPAELRKQIKEGYIEIKVTPGSAKAEATQEPSPGPRGKAPFHGHIRKYQETAQGTIKYRGVPGISGESSDRGEFEGPVELQLLSMTHSDPSDIGILKERTEGESTWGPAAQTRNYADLVAVSKEAGGEEGFVIGNARLLRGGQEIIVYFEHVIQNPTPTLVERIYVGALRLVKLPSEKDPSASKAPLAEPSPDRVGP